MKSPYEYEKKKLSLRRILCVSCGVFALKFIYIYEDDGDTMEMLGASHCVVDHRNGKYITFLSLTAS